MMTVLESIRNSNINSTVVVSPNVQATPPTITYVPYIWGGKQQLVKQNAKLLFILINVAKLPHTEGVYEKEKKRKE